MWVIAFDISLMKLMEQKKHIALFVLIFNVTVNPFPVIIGQVFLCGTILNKSENATPKLFATYI